MSRFFGFLAAIALALCAPAAHADSEQEYREAFIEGRRLFDEEDWRGARAAFERAYELRQTPILLFNIGSTHRREGDLQRALEYYQRYLQEADADDGLRETETEVIAEIEEDIAAEERAAAARDDGDGDETP